MVEKSQNKIIFITLIAIVIVGGIILINSSINSTGNVIKNNFQEDSQQNCREEPVPYEEIEEYIDTVPYIDTECEDEILIYSVTDFNIQSECLDYDERCLKYFLGLCTEKETFCVKKSIHFGLKINNFDEERGTWPIQFILYGDSSIIDTKSQNVFLYPKESSDLYWTFTLFGEEDCKKNIGGNYIVENEPIKQICEEVTRYKDITRTRTITKYKTKTICD